MKQSNWQLKSVFDIKSNNNTDEKKCDSDEERKRNEAQIRRGTLMNKSKEIEINLGEIKNKLDNRKDFFQQMENRNISPNHRRKDTEKSALS